MNYDGPSFYKEKQPKIKSIDQDKDSHSEQSATTKESTEQRKAPLNNPKIESRFENHYITNKDLPKSSQSLEGLRKAKKNKDLIVELEERLNKEKEDYLLFSEYLSEEETIEKIKESTKENLDEEPADSEKMIKTKKKIEKVRKEEKEALIPPKK